MIEGFRAKLKEEGRSMKWFHNKFLKDICKYGYFIKQINVPDCMQENLENIIQEYLGGTVCQK